MPISEQLDYVHAAAGGGGSAAVQLAYATGAIVFEIAEAMKLERVVQLGADHVIDYRTQGFAAVVAQKTESRGVDVVIDFVGDGFASVPAGLTGDHSDAQPRSNGIPSNSDNRHRAGKHRVQSKRATHILSRLERRRQ